MGEFLIVSRKPCDLHPEGRHYVAHVAEALLEDTMLTMKAAIVAIGNSFEEAQTIANNME